jgi:hypothetical protein
MSEFGSERADLWRKSSYTSGSGNCVEVADLGDLVGVRDSKHPDGAVILVTRAAWRAFVDAVKRDELDR